MKLMNFGLFDASLRNHLINDEIKHKSIIFSDNTLKPELFREIIKQALFDKKKILVLVDENEDGNKFAKWLAMIKLSRFVHNFQDKQSLVSSLLLIPEESKNKKYLDNFSQYEIAKWKYNHAHDLILEDYKKLNQPFINSKKIFQLINEQLPKKNLHGLSTIGFAPNTNLTKSDWLINKGRIKELAELYQVNYAAISKLDKLALKYADEANNETGQKLLKRLIQTAESCNNNLRNLEIEIKSYWTNQLLIKTTIIKNKLEDKLNNYKTKQIINKNRNLVIDANDSFFQKQNTRNIAKERYIEQLRVFLKKNENIFGIADSNIYQEEVESIHNYLCTRLDAHIYSQKESFLEKLKHVVFSSVSEGNIASYNSDINDLINKVNKAKVFKVKIEDNTLSFEHKSELVERILQDLKNNLWILSNQKEYLRWVNVYNHLSPNLKSVLNKLIASPPDSWESNYETLIKEYVITNNNIDSIKVEKNNTQSLYHDSKNLIELSPDYISALQQYSLIVSLRDFKKKNKKAFKSIIKKKLDELNWSTALAELVTSRHPIIVCQNQYFEEFREFFDDTNFDLIITDNSKLGSFFLDHDVINLKSAQTEDSSLLNLSEYLVDYKYFDNDSSLKMLSKGEKLLAGQGLDSMVRAYQDNLRIFQFKGCTVISFLKNSLHEDFLQSILSLGAKELRDSISLPFSFQDILIEEDSTFVFLTDYQLLDFEKYDSIVWQQYMIHKFKKMGMIQIDFSNDSYEQKYGKTRKIVLDSLDRKKNIEPAINV